MARRDDDTDVTREPHLNQAHGFTPDPTEPGEDDQPLPASDEALDEHLARHGVWDEPGLSPALSGAPPEQAVTYARWYQKQRQRTSLFKSWAIMTLLALLAGPAAVLGAFAGMQTGGWRVAAIVVIAPVTEELLKAVLPMYTTETRPYLIRSGWQILLCGLAGGLAFATIENLIYLNIYIPDPSASLALWRWTVCSAMHTVCAGIAAIGVWQVWRVVDATGQMPDLKRALPALAVAIVIHGGYNAFALMLSLSDYNF